jgi:protein-tyrosine phosphatase
VIGVSILCPDPWNEVIDGLWVGGHDYQPADCPLYSLDAIVENEFDLVISLYRRTGHGPANGVLHVFMPVPDSRLHESSLRDVRVLADWAVEAVRAGKRVLVRCQAGLNRSSLVVAFALLRLGYTADDAIALIRRRRSPRALFNSHFQDYIRAEAKATAR